MFTAASSCDNDSRNGWLIPAPAPWARTRSHLGLAGARNRADTSAPPSIPKRIFWEVGMAGDAGREEFVRGWCPPAPIAVGCLRVAQMGIQETGGEIGRALPI